MKINSECLLTLLVQNFLIRNSAPQNGRFYRSLCGNDVVRSTPSNLPIKKIPRVKVHPISRFSFEQDILHIRRSGYITEKKYLSSTSRLTLDFPTNKIISKYIPIICMIHILILFFISTPPFCLCYCSGVPTGVGWFKRPTPPRNSKVLTKLSRIPSSWKIHP
jgi:hypothetical protein